MDFGLYQVMPEEGTVKSLETSNGSEGVRESYCNIFGTTYFMAKYKTIIFMVL